MDDSEVALNVAEQSVTGADTNRMSMETDALEVATSNRGEPKEITPTAKRPGARRKVASQLSTNAFSIKGQQRMAAIRADPIAEQYNKAVNADRQIKKTIRTNLKKSNSWKTVDKALFEAELERQFTLKMKLRKREGKDADSVARKLNYEPGILKAQQKAIKAESDAINSKYGDENIPWEDEVSDVDWEDETMLEGRAALDTTRGREEAEVIAQQNEKFADLPQYTFEEIDDIEEKIKGGSAVLKKMIMDKPTRIYQAHWKRVYNRLDKKTSFLNTRGINQAPKVSFKQLAKLILFPVVVDSLNSILPPQNHKEATEISDLTKSYQLKLTSIEMQSPAQSGPDNFFDKEEKMMWRNMAKWAVPPDDKNEVWIQLPGPSEFWPGSDDDDDGTILDAIGFYIPGGKASDYKRMADAMFNEELDGHKTLEKYERFADDREFRLFKRTQGEIFW